MGIPVIEHKALAGSPVVVEDRVVTGFPAVLGNVDDGGDVSLPGAFAKTVKERAARLRFLWNHDHKAAPIARVLQVAEVGPNELPAELKARYPEVTGALMVQRQYLETPRAEEVFQGVKSGAINELSYAYDAIQTGAPEEVLRWGNGARRLLKEVRLWEFSDVNWGMNPATMNVKDLGLFLDQLPKVVGPERAKALAEWFEGQLHLRFTEMADQMFSEGFLTREERIALSGLISGALDTFNAGMQADPRLAGVRERERFEKPDGDDSGKVEVAMPMQMHGAGEPDADTAAQVAAAVKQAHDDRQRRVRLAMQRLQLAGA